jgi:uncharacterized membrane protein
MADAPDPSPQATPPPHVAPPAHLESRAVPWRRAFVWYEDAMRLVKRRPVIWAVLAFLTLATEFALQAVPGFGPTLGKIIGPLVACGMLYAAAAADRGDAPRLAHAVAAFRTPAPTIVAIIIASVLTFAAEALTAWWIADIDLLATDSAADDLSTAAIAGIYTIGILASLPLTFVPFHVLFERVAPGSAFAASWNAFTLNTLPLLVYGAVSLLLLGFGLLTMGIGLVLVLPLWSASSYAAWKDVFDVHEPPAAA